MALESALRYLRASVGTDGTSSPTRAGSIAERLALERDALFDWARQAGCLLGASECLSRVTGGGVEHAVFFDERTQRYFKITRGFALTVGVDYRLGKKTQRWVGVPFVREATPFEYLERIALFNQAFGDDVRLEGVIADAGANAILTSQPFIRGRAASPIEIAGFMESLGFLAVEGVAAGRQDSVSFFRPSDGVAVFDTHGENYLSEGTHVTPIDAFIVRAGADLGTFLTMPASDRHAEVGRWTSSIGER